MPEENFVNFTEDKNKARIERKKTIQDPDINKVSFGIKNADGDINEKKLNSDLTKISNEITDAIEDMNELEGDIYKNKSTEDVNYETNNFEEDEKYDNLPTQAPPKDFENIEAKNKKPENMPPVDENMKPEQNLNLKDKNNNIMPDDLKNDFSDESKEEMTQKPDEYNPFPLEEQHKKPQEKYNESQQENYLGENEKNQKNIAQNQKEGSHLRQTINKTRYRSKLKKIDNKIQLLQTQEIPFKNQIKKINSDLLLNNLKKYLIEGQIVFWLIILIILAILWLILVASIFLSFLAAPVSAGLVYVWEMIAKLGTQLVKLKLKIEKLKKSLKKVKKIINRMERTVARFFNLKQQILNK